MGGERRRNTKGSTPAKVGVELVRGVRAWGGGPTVPRDDAEPGGCYCEQCPGPTRPVLKASRAAASATIWLESALPFLRAPIWAGVYVCRMDLAVANAAAVAGSGEEPFSRFS